jgi:hypothetical protein
VLSLPPVLVSGTGWCKVLTDGEKKKKKKKKQKEKN